MLADMPSWVQTLIVLGGAAGGIVAIIKFLAWVGSWIPAAPILLKVVEVFGPNGGQSFLDKQDKMERELKAMQTDVTAIKKQLGVP